MKQPKCLESWLCSRCKAAWVLIALALLISGCQALTDPKKPDLPIGLKPFSHLGGNSPGDIVFIGDDGYPYSCVPAHMSARYGKNIQRAKQEELANREYEITNAFRGTVEALALRGDISRATKDQLTRLASLKLRVDEATREYLEDGTSAFSGFMLKQQSGNLRNFSAQIVDSCGMEEVSLILEVLKVVRGSYIAEWSAELDLPAKVEALQILGGEVQGNWDNDRKVRIVSTRPVALGYRDWPLPMDRLKTARETGTY